MSKSQIFSLKSLSWIWLIFTVSFLDYISKIWIKNNFMLYEIKKITSYFNIFYTQNYGIAFGFFSHQNYWNKWFFLSVIFIIILYFFSKICFIASRNFHNAAYSLIIGGAVGNFFDRIHHDCVIDFFDFHFGSWHFPTFNIADVFIFIGTVASIVLEFFFKPNKNLSMK